MEKKLSTQRYLIPTGGPEAEPAERAFRLLYSLLTGELSAVKLVVLFVPTLGHLEDTTVGDVLGSKDTRTLERGQPLRLTETAQMVVKTLRTLNRYEYPEVVLAAYVDKKMLDAIDSLIQPKALIVLPWNEAEVEGWRRSWNPIVLGQGPLPQEDLLPNSIVEEALETLTKSINLGTGLHHSSDKESAESLLWHLSRAGEWVDPERMRAWALRRGWSPRAADQLQLLAEKTQKRRSPPKGAHSYWGSGAVDRFRQKIEQRKGDG